MESRYRPDIDGLRAIAVLSVIVFHIWPDALPGGFVGVDIFFVISGYLITLQILRDLASGQFSIGGFYRRRIKRIAPAMMAMLLATIIAAEFLLRPADAEAVSRSGLWSLLSLANVYFWLSEDESYFAASTDEIPLLHLWSLGVEEQFYIFWPLVLLLLARHMQKRAAYIGMATLIAASFAFGQYFYPVDPSFVFYMLPSRVAELMLGAVAAMLVIRHETREVSTVFVSACAFAGILLVSASLFLVSSEHPFPGFQAIPPTVGTTLLILAGHYGSALPNQWLTVRPMVLVGLLSYSAYLWHWPMLAFLRYGGFDVTGLLGVAVFIGTFLIAGLSYRFVETPLRRSTQPLPAVFARQYLAPACLIGALALTSLKSDGFALRWIDADYRDQLRTVQESVKPAPQYDYVCQKPRLVPEDLHNEDCRVGENRGSGKKVLLFGDSVAAQYVGVLGVFARESGFSFYNVAVGGCPPVKYGLQKIATSRRVSDCLSSHPQVWLAAKEYDVVILGSYWPGYYPRIPDFFDYLEATLRDLLERDIRIVLLGMTPIIHGFDRYCREKSLSFPLMDCSMRPVPLDEDVIRVNARLRELAASIPGVDYFDVNDYLCPDGICDPAGEDGLPRYFDPYHMSMPASWRLGNRIVLSEGVPPMFDLGER